MKTTKSFPCAECGGPVAPRTGEGRMREYRSGLSLPVPDDFAMLTCSKCGEIYLSEEDDDRLDEIQKPAYLEWQKRHLGQVVGEIQKAMPTTSLRALERACGVTPTYLSHLMAGRKEASATLVYLLEAYSLYPAEAERRLSNHSWSEALKARSPSRAAFYETQPVVIDATDRREWHGSLVKAPCFERAYKSDNRDTFAEYTPIVA